MANIFSIFKQVRPKKTILSDDFNGLQNALKTSLDTLGTQAPPGKFGVSSAFNCADPVADDDAVNKRFLTANFDVVAAPSLAAAALSADEAAASAALASAIALGDVSSVFDTKADLAGDSTQAFYVSSLIATTAITIAGNTSWHAGNFDPSLKVDTSQVLTDVPSGALFTDTDTDTTYSEATTAVLGLVKFATQAEADTGTHATHVLTPALVSRHLFDQRLFSGI